MPFRKRRTQNESDHHTAEHAREHDPAGSQGTHCLSVPRHTLDSRPPSVTDPEVLLGQLLLLSLQGLKDAHLVHRRHGSNMTAPVGSLSAYIPTSASTFAG